MNIKIKAYQLKESGLSYGQIAKQLKIGRTTAYDYIKEIKMQGLSTVSQTPIIKQHGVNLINPNIKEQKAELKEFKDNKEHLPQKKKVKEFTGNELIEKKFDSLEFEGKFKELIGKPSKLFSAIIWGLPKGGKSNFSIRFADYLQEYFGDVVYIAAEEGESVTLQEKIKAIGGSHVTFAENKDRQSIREYIQSKPCHFVFVDSINNVGIDNEFLELLKQENPTKSFVSIVQATKGGNFKGDQALTHNCDFIIKVIEGVAYHSGRFNTTSEINIFSEPLYQKNPNVRMIVNQDSQDQISDILENNTIEILEQKIDSLDNSSVNLNSKEYALGDIENNQSTIPKTNKSMKLNFKKSSKSKTQPINKLSFKPLLWFVGIIGAASLLDNSIKKSKQKETVQPKTKK